MCGLARGGGLSFGALSSEQSWANGLMVQLTCTGKTDQCSNDSPCSPRLECSQPSRFRVCTLWPGTGSAREASRGAESQ